MDLYYKQILPGYFPQMVKALLILLGGGRGLLGAGHGGV